MSIEYRLAKVYLEKFYQQGLITLADKEALDEEMRRLYGAPQNTRINRIA